jgi:2-polyprenylphenol 6-hydroxylase
MAKQVCDIMIIGGGAIGSMMLLALKDSGKTITLIDAKPILTVNKLDNRSLALSRASVKILEHLMLWEKIAVHTTPIRSIHVSEKSSFGYTSLQNSADNNLGFMISMRVLNEIIIDEMKKLDSAFINILPNTKLISIKGNILSLENDNPISIEAGLIIAADGTNSEVRKLTNTSYSVKDYKHCVIASTLNISTEHNNTAFERFTPNGPIAFLPLQDEKSCGIIWSLTPDCAQKMLDVQQDEFLKALQKQFGWRLGKLHNLQTRVMYPLRQIITKQTGQNNIVFVGNAAQTLHPVAGQGFNLGLRDVICLAQNIKHNLDIKTYLKDREADTKAICGLTDVLIKSFTTVHWLKPLRGLSLAALNSSQMLQKEVSLYASGFAGLPCLDHVDHSYNSLVLQKVIPSECEGSPVIRNKSYKAKILGGGIIGLSTALTLHKHHGFDVTIVDKDDFTYKNLNSLDARVYALNLSSINFLKTLNIWQHIKLENLSAYKSMQIFDANGGMLNLDSKLTSDDYLGFIIEENILKNALLKELKACNIKYSANQELNVGDLNTGEDLLLICDGANSPSMQLLNLEKKTISYKQNALVVNVKTAIPHANTAYQVFTKHGPLAYLPMHDGHTCSIVWSHYPGSIDLNNLESELNQYFGNILGKTTLLNKPQIFPLYLRNAKNYSYKNYLILGDAAHTIHPMAGLGLNLGISDITALSQILQENSNIISLRVLKHYQRLRKYEVMKIIALLDSIKLIFQQKTNIMQKLRKISLATFNRNDRIKRLLIEFANKV